MRGTNKIIINTIILYTKVLLCMIISLWTVPIVLGNLGAERFGLYNLIAGVVAMLAFLNGAMTVSTQRFFSVCIGEKDSIKLLEIYNLSLVLHIILGIIVILLVEFSIPLLLNHVMNIPSDSVAIARNLFHYLVVSIFFTITAVPFDAIMNAKEDMLVFSIIGTAEVLLKLLLALSLPYISGDRLNYYGYMIMFIAIVIFLMKFIYVQKMYSKIFISRHYCKNKQLFRDLCSFAGWNTLASIAIIGRNQGIALVLNHFFGTVINAAYGISNQVNGVLGYFSQTIQKSINPQLMESHGSKDENKMNALVLGLTKFSTLSIGIVAMPIFIEIHYILKLWLSDIPENTEEFTRLIIILSIVFQLSSGLMSAIQSTGKIKWYTINICILMLSILPLSYFSIAQGQKAEVALIIACVIEVFALCFRLYFAKKLIGISVKEYVSKLIVPLIIIHIATLIFLWGVCNVMDESMARLMIVFGLGIVVYSLLAYYLILTHSEKQKIVHVLRKIKYKI